MRPPTGILPLLAAVISSVADEDGGPLVITEYGPVRGTWGTGGVASFYKVPYAGATGGAQRWRPARAPDPWTVPVNGTAPDAGACLQMNPFSTPGLANSAVTLGTEDCLFSIIYSPRLPSEDGAQPPRAPVFVWIHGGAFVLGDAWEEGMLAGGALLARRFGMVVVSMQYRLGPLGFFALPAVAAESDDGTMGNQGLQDQRFGLQWVQRNIARFGGDPRAVVIGGESAGGYSVCWHMASPMSRGLFAGGITESGGCDTNLMLGQAIANAESLAASVGCPTGARQMACLREKDGTEFFNTSNPAQIAALTSVWPVVDGAPSGLPDTQLRLLRSGRGSRVPWLLGHNSDEFQFGCLAGQALRDCYSISFFFNGTRPNSSLSRQALEYDSQTLGLDVRFTDEQWAQVIAKYPLEDYNHSESERLSTMFSDFDFEGPSGEGGSLSIGQCETLRAAYANVALGVPTFVFHYDFHTAALGTSAQLVQHGDEEYFVFESAKATATARGARMAHVLGLYWSSFVKTLAPNSPQTPVPWPELGATGQILRIAGPIPAAERPSRTSYCNFWQQLLVGQPVPSPPARESLAASSSSSVAAAGLLLAAAAAVAQAVGRRLRPKRQEAAGQWDVAASYTAL